MIAKTPVAAALAVLVVGYVAYPCTTFYRLNAAVRTGNARELRKLVDWSSVQEGVKEDLADDPAGPGGQELAPFGSSFIKGAAVDGRMTPDGLLTTLRDAGPTAGQRGGFEYAYFTGPASFMVVLGTGQRHQRIKLLMQLQDGSWRVTRAWLPEELLSKARQSTTATRD